MILWSRVRDLHDEVGAEGFDEVVALFLDEAGDVIDRLKSGDCPDDLDQLLHFLKGSALSLGFAAFADLCRDGECRAAAGDAAKVDIAAITDAFDRSRTQFLAGLPGHLAA